ncbi:MAG: hypothetical protein QOG99_77 [Frankiales bacterium]|nr:hypothetical protein [Frankiales bacterium]
MSGPLTGIRVIELAGGRPSALAGMILADQGADVVLVEPPEGRAVRSLPGERVWDRGKRSVVLNLDVEGDRAQLLALLAGADVLLEALLATEVTQWDLGPETLRELNPMLVHCSLSAYGGAFPEEDEARAAAAGPAAEMLVSARLGAYHEQRGWYGTPMDRILGIEGGPDDLDVPVGAEQGPDRDGPLAVASPWAGLSTALNAALGISASLVARLRTGSGQHLSTSMLQGLFAVNFSSWQRPENIDADLYRMWVLDRRAPKGLFACADGRWVHQWPMNPFAVTEASQAATLDDAVATRNRDDIRRLGMSPDDLIVLLHYFPDMVEAHRRFNAEEWVRFGARADVGLQLVRSPEEALQDPDFLADQTVIDVADREHGLVRQPGLGFALSRDRGEVRRGAPALGEHTEEVLADLPPTPTPTSIPTPTAPSSGRLPAGSGPLAGIRVLDLGLGVAGPFATSLLAELGADVIKVNTQWDGFWLAMHMGAAANRGKRSLSVDLKDPRGRELVRRLALSADVVAHNMRTGAAERLGLDYDSLSADNPGLVYCHSRGFDHGSRLGLPGTDQTAGALCGTSYEDGAVHRGGSPFWSPTSMGDTGNGWLSAIGIVQALYQRELTGRGQSVDSAIVNACLLATSATYVRADGTAPQRARLDPQMLGFSALHRLYPAGTDPTTEDWFALAAVDDAAASALLSLVGLGDEDRFADADARALHDEELAKELESRFADADVTTWIARLQAGGVPCEPASARFTQRLFDDERLRQLGLTTTQQHPVIGRLDTYGDLITFDGTPTSPGRPAPLCGQHSREILTELGLSPEEVDALIEGKVIVDVAVEA